MDRLRLSASDLDAFRYYMASEDAELADLLAQLRRETEPTEQMQAGTALHSALEDSDAGEFDSLSANGFTFRFDAEGEIDLPVILEMKETKDVAVNGCIVTLVGKVDAVHGRRVDDHKFTSQYDPERFLNSFQWRIYLDIFGADEFRWNIFEGRKVEDGQYVITAMHPLTMHRYPGMAADIDREIAAFVSFARQHLPEKLGREAA